MDLYGPKQLADSMRTVRKNTILIAEDIPEKGYAYRPTPESRSVVARGCLELPCRQGRGYSWRDGPASDVWLARERGSSVDGACGCAPQKREGVQADWQADPATRYSVKDERHSAIWLGCQRAGNAHGGRRAASRVRRESGEV